MSVTSVGSSKQLLPLMINDISDDNLIDIFLKVLKERLYDFRPMSEVCRQWNRLLLEDRVGRAVFSFNCIEHVEGFPVWTMAYLFAVRNFFNHAPGKPLSLRYPQHYDFTVGKVAWIEGEGFIHFVGKEFHVFQFFSLHRPDRIETSDPITAMRVVGDQILCGLVTGKVIVYDLQTLDLSFSTSVHCEEVVKFFPYKDSWISISKKQIYFWDRKQRASTLVWQFAECPVKPQFQLSGHYLLFYASNTDCYPHYTHWFYRERSLYCIDLRLEKGPLMTGFPEKVGTQLSGWGNRIYFFDYRGYLDFNSTSKISHLRVLAENEFDEEMNIPMNIVGTGERPYLYPAGHFAFVVSDEDFMESDTSVERIQLIRLYGNKNVVLDFYEGDRLLMNDEGYVCTVMGNHFVYFLGDASAIKIIPFPLEPKKENLDLSIEGEATDLLPEYLESLTIVNHDF